MSKSLITEASAADTGQRDGREAADGALATPDSLLAAGRAALRRGEWETAREHFERFIGDVDDEGPEPWEGLGSACYWLQDAVRMFDARHQAYQRYRARGDMRSAARVAVWLGNGFLEFRGEAAVAGGWFERAHQLLEGLSPCIEHAWLRQADAYFALAVRQDTVAARAAAIDSREIARAVGDVDVEMLARALEGLTLVIEGEIADGMRQLDASAAAALGGEMADLNAISITCCFVVQACARVRDFERATEWCRRFHELSTRWRLGTFLTFCRIHYGTVLLWRGEWVTAEHELIVARADLEALKPASRATALVLLGELRRRQGRWEEAAALLEEAGAHPLASLSSAALALDRGDAAIAEELAAQTVRRTAGAYNGERVTAIDLLARARAARGATDTALEAVAQLTSLAAEIGTDSVRATALFAAGVVARASGREDEARELLGDSADLFESAGLPFETACARLELGRACLVGGRAGTAREQMRFAIEHFERIGASRHTEQARAVLEEATLADGTQPPRDDSSAACPLTRRQLQVLEYVAHGLSDREIATKLFLSEFTVRRHVANIFDRLGVSSRAAAVASAIRQNFV
jgi:ATP/maltotriose-dependent transcriptional regulator MalT